ncbi:MAG: hypothetical protein AAB373_01905 [Patescibacteria group bacterium]
MKFTEIQSALEYLVKKSTCLHCKAKYTFDDIQIIASTKFEGLFELRCSKCDSSSIVTVFLSPTMETMSEGVDAMVIGDKISNNDILDIKNFLSGFDGNFKKLFIKEK